MKTLALVFGLLIVPTLALAQNNQPTAAPSEYVIKIKGVDLDKIGKALGKLPFEEVAELMQILRQQVYEQQSKAKPVDGSEKPKNEPAPDPQAK